TVPMLQCGLVRSNFSFDISNMLLTFKLCRTGHKNYCFGVGNPCTNVNGFFTIYPTVFTILHTKQESRAPETNLNIVFLPIMQYKALLILKNQKQGIKKWDIKMI
ncbi:MAG: hypothetical protein ACTHOO_12460, partial [Alcanivorax sp.]